jgi:hypothetical protein
MAAPKKKTSISLAAGCVAGAVECCCTWPMEYIKTQLQSFRTVKGGPAPPFTGIGSGLAYTVRTTGALSLYNGLAPVLAFSAPKAGVRFGANTHFRNALADPDTGKVSMGASFLAGQQKGDSMSLQRECSARARFGKHIHASRPLREMIARPKISRNERKTAEIGAFEVGNVAPFCCPGSSRASARASARRRSP